ncbi:hypothetical protein L916_02992 [Phytophthora nicotianae]|uniref:VWFA domain-containing protein n=2 Tax=Phytophthora nicotianae TaxID=4792 RepID=W2JND9_PHYNI|nr:hypothetical protein L916_02992 [Phytophthora nicotianae]
MVLFFLAAHGPTRIRRTGNCSQNPICSRELRAKMEIDEGANFPSRSADSGEGGKFSGGDNLFRLMKLVRETQCEREVVKPVLDELEVMRMCRSFGMMSSVNPKDFDFNVLHAREFDDDFIRFLRFELFENACLGDVKLKGVFGKQAQVAEILVDMKACFVNAVGILAGASEGIYCVKVKPEHSEGQCNGVGNIAGLVVFPWICDELFEPQGLRDTPAFVLRFLTGLTSDIICCTSKSDLEQVAAAMAASEEQEDDELSSYSVSFHIEKQEDQPDSTSCVAMTSVELETLPEDYSNICLLKGSYPAIAVTRTMTSVIRTEPFRRLFRLQVEVPFAEWLKAESQHCRIELNPGIVRSVKLCQNILKAFDMWPEDEINAAREAQEKQEQEEYDLAAKTLKEEIAEQRAMVDQVTNELFRLHVGDTVNEASGTSLQTALSAYEAFREWVKSTCHWKFDKKIQLILDVPERLREVEAMLLTNSSCYDTGELIKILETCSTTSKSNLLKAVNKHKVKNSNPDVNMGAQKPTWESFLEEVSKPLAELRTKWWIAVKSVFAAANDVKLKELKCNQKQSKAAWYGKIIGGKFDQLREVLLSKDGLLFRMSACPNGRGTVYCEGSKEVYAQSCAFQDIVKLDMQEGKPRRQELLGRHLLNPGENHVAMFTVKVRSVIQIVTGTQRMCVKFIYFPPSTDPRRPSRANERVIHTLGKFASLCDYDARNRILTFLSEDSVGIYKLDGSFKKMELMKNVDLGVRSTLADLPFRDVMLLDSTVYVTDSSGRSQGVDIHNDQTSNVVNVHDQDEIPSSCSRVLELADNLAIGAVSCVPSDDGAFEGVLQCVSRDDHRHLPALSLGVKFLTDRVSVQHVDDRVLVLDPLAQKVYFFSIQVTVRSDSYRMRQSDNAGSKNTESDASNADCPRKQHWLYTFYHVFEKFPVRGLLDVEVPSPVSILVACPGVEETNAALENYHDFLSLLMSDLMALNKPLYGLDLTSGLAVRSSLGGVTMKSKPLKLFFQALITFLPIQICRAEGNALTVLYDGMDQSLEPEDEIQAWGAADIAESIRFGLLSPLLCAWRGRCAVITSMGKQSTGKSYFLNHLTGSSFAIAGNRCTDGAWMTLRIMEDMLLVVLDFEGLGSFERTDQEDVFLSVLNASLSMFTIFRMEMRFDKDIDGLFTKFQKGINLLKSDERLFQGKLYMSVKDVNPNDRHGVLSEFQHKFQKMVTVNRDKNFLTEMYSGQLKINCSPPLGTLGYYDSLRHARQLIEELINDPDLSRGFKSGSSFHDCIRLVLAKISILDWTAVDESSQRLEMNELHRKLPGAIRTGCLIPVEAQAKDESLSRILKDPLLHDNTELYMLNLVQLCCDYPDFSENWAIVNQEVALGEMDDEDVDFGPAACFQANTSSIHFTLQNLFQRYLALISKGPLEKIVDKDYANFDALLSFLVCRRKTKVLLWVKQFLGSERFMDEWEQIEQTYILPFEALFKRCLHTCAKCQLQCMRSVCHSFDEDHDCGMSHQCRGLCEYCALNYRHGKEMPRCVGRAGHEGKCDCVKGDHTCGAECSLKGASNCGGLCVLIEGHEGDHRCSVKRHACGALCSATICRGKCILNAEHRHTVHKCAETQCKHACEMDGCKERCSTANHFHDQPELGVRFAEENDQKCEAEPSLPGEIIHLCSSRHTCNAACEMEGICAKSVQVSIDKFLGSRDTFDYELKQMIGIRNNCAIVLQPGESNHDGKTHSCVKLLPNGTRTVHGCGVRCEACEYYCDKRVGHEGEHSAAHGNMRNMHFVAEDDVIKWEDHKYLPGEKGVAEMCNMYCSSAGRGHVHYLKCDKETDSACVYTDLQDQRRHCTNDLKPRPEHQVDELLHEKYWKTIGWEDPCRSAVERALFAKCPYLCDAAEHNGEGKPPSYCDLEAWHQPASTPSTTERRGFSYICGHRFACSHASSTGKVHHVFVLDCSGSMRGEPWQELVSGVRGYLRSRLATGVTQDIVSVVTFGARGIIEFEAVPINSAPSRRIDFHGGGTFYSNGLSQANAILSRTNLSVYKPVMIFFTDGRPADRKKGPALAVDVRNRFAKFGLRTFVVGYGRASDMGLEDLAEKLGGSVHEALTTADLGEAFRSISMSLGARAGLIHTTAAA